VLGEFFPARPDEIDEAIGEHGPFERFPTVEAKTVDAVSISTLGEILCAGPYDELLNRALDDRQAEGGEAGITPVAKEIRDALTTTEDLESVAERWGRTEEMAAWEPEDVREVVRELAALAIRAREANQAVWFWWSV
jgi:hypothetical protein